MTVIYIIAAAVALIVVGEYLRPVESIFSQLEKLVLTRGKKVSEKERNQYLWGRG